MTWIRASRSLCILLVCAAVVGCSGPTDRLPVYSNGAALSPDDPAYMRDVQIKYYGAGGVLLQRAGDKILFAPFFSNPSMLRVAFGEIRSIPGEVDHFLGPDAARIAGVSAMLVGHAHYDHLMDVPYVRSRYIPGVPVYGSKTVRNILLAAFPNDPRLVAVDKQPEDIGRLDHTGKWWYATPRIRFMALASLHSPIALHHRFFEGDYDAPLGALPTRATGWKGGTTYAWLVDFLAPDGQVEFRVHYQDAASNPPWGLPPRAVVPPDGRRVDLALVCMPGFQEVQDYPETLVALLRPRFLVLIHWEDFFERLPDDPHKLRTVALLDAAKFLQRLQPVLPHDARVWLTAPGAQLHFPPPQP
jgi:L-ascorbate metabolism protein UlaG (beta-lactamase superfamily)